jgi:nitrogen fixation NifU-like protein|tara:strand:+ start:214 stop:612 length:399 start_codon:yes stop_codon:yes gene_type:complete
MDLEILKIASNTSNIKVLKDYTHHSRFKNKLCGDVIDIYLKIYDGKIKDVSYKSNSCSYCIASANLLSKNIKNKDLKIIRTLLKQFVEFFDKDFLKIPSQLIKFKKLLLKKNFQRKECIKLPFRALEKAISE